MDWYRVVKTINGRRYIYEQKTYRVGKRVKTLNRYIGRYTGSVIANTSYVEPRDPFDLKNRLLDQIRGASHGKGDAYLVRCIPEKLEPLAAEAKKYKSADEFVQAQPTYYHGTNAEFDEFDPSKQNFSGWLSKGFYFTKERSEAAGFGQNIKERYLALKNPFKLQQDKVNSDGSVTFAKSTREQVFEAFPETRDMKWGDVSDFLQKKGYDGIDNGVNVAVFDPKTIKTKAQLTDFYDKLHST